MTNKELLEHAANATGKPWKWVESSKYDYKVPGMKHIDEVNNVVYWFPWNPLEDNDKSFELMVDLGIEVTTITLPHVVYVKAATNNTTSLEVLHNCLSVSQPDRKAATRLVIVKTAAKQMKVNNE